MSFIATITAAPSPLVGEGGFAKRRRVRGSLRGCRPLIRRGLRIADAKHRRPIKERRPEAAYGHFLPQGEKETSLRVRRSTKQKWPGLLPAISSRERFASARRRDARGRGRQRCRAAVEQRRDAADGDAPVDTAWSACLLLSILRTITLRGQVFRRDLELLRQQFGRGLGATRRQRQIVDVVAERIGVAVDQELLARVALDRPV